MQKIKKFRKIEKLEEYLDSLGYSGEFIDIIQSITEKEFSYDEAKSLAEINKLILDMWNEDTVQNKPNLKTFKITFFLIYSLKQEIKNKGNKIKKPKCPYHKRTELIETEKMFQCPREDCLYTKDK